MGLQLSQSSRGISCDSPSRCSRASEQPSAITRRRTRPADHATQRHFEFFMHPARRVGSDKAPSGKLLLSRQTAPACGSLSPVISMYLRNLWGRARAPRKQDVPESCIQIPRNLKVCFEVLCRT